MAWERGVRAVVVASVGLCFGLVGCGGDDPAAPAGDSGADTARRDSAADSARETGPVVDSGLDTSPADMGTGDTRTDGPSVVDSTADVPVGDVTQDTGTVDAPDGTVVVPDAPLDTADSARPDTGATDGNVVITLPSFDFDTVNAWDGATAFDNDSGAQIPTAQWLTEGQSRFIRLAGALRATDSGAEEAVAVGFVDGAGRNFSGARTIRARVRITGAPTVKFYMKTGAGWSWQELQPAPVAANLGSFTELVWDVSSYTTLADVRQLAIEVSGVAASYTFDIDYIRVESSTSTGDAAVEGGQDSASVDTGSEASVDATTAVDADALADADAAVEAAVCTFDAGPKPDGAVVPDATDAGLATTLLAYHFDQDLSSFSATVAGDGGVSELTLGTQCSFAQLSAEFTNDSSPVRFSHVATHDLTGATQIRAVVSSMGATTGDIRLFVRTGAEGTYAVSAPWNLRDLTSLTLLTWNFAGGSAVNLADVREIGVVVDGNPELPATKQTPTVLIDSIDVIR